MGTNPTLLARMHVCFSWQISVAYLLLFVMLSTITAYAANPVITLQGSNPTTIFLNATYADAGATAIDSNNDSVTVDINALSVDTTKVGSYTVHFSATDSALNTSTTTRTVNVTVVLTPILLLLLGDDEEIDPNADHIPPVVTVIGISPVLVLKNDPYIDAGATAFDTVDGVRPVSSNAQLVDTSIVKTYNVRYSAQDLSGNTGTADRTVEVVEDTSPPVIVTDSFTIEAGSTYTDSPIQTSDNSNGEITLTRNSFINTASVGSTIVAYTATDPSGNTTNKDITVHVVDTTKPQLVIAGDNPVTIEAGNVYADAGAVTTDNSNSNVTIQAIGDVINTLSVTPVNSPNEVSYTATDGSGNISNSIIRTVNVIDTTPPVITLIEKSSIKVVVDTVNSTFVDPGAETTDNSNGSVSLTVNVNGVGGNTIDISSVGAHTVTYTAVDASGNLSEKTRTVTVIQTDNTAPIITLKGSSFIQVVRDSTYIDEGATVIDDIDLTVLFSTSPSFIDTSVLSNAATPTLSLEFTATDSHGNNAIPVIREIEIVEADTTEPSIILNQGNTTIKVKQGSSYTDPGAIAFDANDGNIPVTIDTSGVNTNVLGVTNNVVTFSATDAAGNTFELQRVNIEVVPDLGDIKGLWNLNENTGSTANDSAGNINHLTIENVDVSSWVTGNSNPALGSALNLTESQVQHASIDNATNALRPQSVTLSAWINVSATPTPGASRDWEWIAAQGDNYGLYIFPTTRELVFYKREAVRNTWIGVDSVDNVINYNQWHHVVGTFDSASNTMKLYLDGVEVASKSTNANGQPFEGIGYDQGNGFTIGSMQGGRLFNGIIDEVSVYDKAISGTDIAHITNNTQLDTLAPIIHLNGRNSLTVVVGTDYIDEGATVTDDTDSGLTVHSDADVAVDTSTIGIYFVTFRATDVAGNTAKQIRTVEVIAEDITAPTISLNGPDPINVALNSSYTDLGADATDDVDGDVNVVINSSFVNTAIAGFYAVTFTAEDAAGNISTATRTVRMLTNPPVDKTVFEGTYDGSDKPVNGRRGSIVFNDYVDPIANNGTAIANWLTQSSKNILTVSSDLGFSAALLAAQPGDRIQLESGVYRMQPISISGTENNPITIESVPGQWAIFDGAKAGSASRINVDETSWLTFRNLEIRNGTSGSIFITQSHYHLYEGLKIHNNARGFDFTDGSSHSLIRFNESYHNFDPANNGQDGDGFGVWSEGIYNDGIGEGVILEYNIAWGNSDDGIDMYKNEATVTLRNNIVRNNGFNVLDDPNFAGNGNGFKLGPEGPNREGQHGHYVIGNIADRNPVDGFDSNGGSAPHYLKGNVATNNGAQDYEVPNRSASEDNTKTGGLDAD